MKFTLPLHVYYELLKEISLLNKHYNLDTSLLITLIVYCESFYKCLELMILTKSRSKFLELIICDPDPWWIIYPLYNNIYLLWWTQGLTQCVGEFVENIGKMATNLKFTSDSLCWVKPLDVICSKCCQIRFKVYIERKTIHLWVILHRNLTTTSSWSSRLKLRANKSVTSLPGKFNAFMDSRHTFHCLVQMFSIYEKA